MRTRYLALAIIAAAACARRPHTNSQYGASNHAFFDRQAQATHAGSARGLDSEEAAIIQKDYRESIGSSAQRTSDPKSSVLILESDRHAATKK